jgi:hypothetical protein
MNISADTTSGGSKVAPESEPRERVARDPGVEAASEQAEVAGPFADAVAHVLEIGLHLRTLLMIRAERRRMRIRGWIMGGIVVLIVAIALVPLILSGVSLLTLGIAQAFAALCGEHVWLGNLLSGFAILGGVALLARVAWYQWSRKSLLRKVAEYGDVAIGEDEAARVAPPANGI